MEAVLERAAGLPLTPEGLEDYLDTLDRKGRSRETLDIYRRNLRFFYDDLPEDKTVRPGTLDGWRQHLLDKGYSPRTVNTRLSTVNSLMDFLGRRDLQSMGTLDGSQSQPELTRTEYLRLLSTARALGKERLYLLVKLFGSTDLALTDLPRLTVATLLEGLASFGEDGVDAMNIIIWVPVLIMLICLIEGRKMLPKTLDGWTKMLLASAKQCCNCGAVSLFAMASSNALNQTSFGEDMTTILSALTLPKFVMILIIGYVIALAAGPMNATSTTVSLGPVAYSAMVSVGVPPVTAIVAYLIFASTEGASPPMSSPIFVSSSIAGLNDVSVMFKPLIFHYCIPIVFVGVLVAMGILPIIGG